MPKENNEKFVPFEIFGENPATRRWFAVSVSEAAKTLLKMRGMVNPSQEEILDFVRKSKEAVFPWIQTQNLASKIRRREFNGYVREHFDGVYTKETIMAAAEAIQQHYSEVDQDQARNCSFLDEIIFSNPD